jgi:hypothetical protein
MKRRRVMYMYMCHEQGIEDEESREYKEKPTVVYMYMCSRTNIHER